MNLEGHFCKDCGCGIEHGCVCDMCDMTEEEWAEFRAYYEKEEEW